MRLIEVLDEGKNTGCIVVDVQPEYAYYSNENLGICERIISFVTNQTGPVLFFVNAEDQGHSADTVQDIQLWWEDIAGKPIDWSRYTVVDKGYGYFRAWMDSGVDDSIIIKTIRLLYQQKLSDSRELFGGEGSHTYEPGMRELLGDNYNVMYDPLSVNWTNISQLKKFNGSYIIGGGRNECLREVELLMNAFNIKYKRIDNLIY